MYEYCKNLMKCNHLENPANTFIVIASCSEQQQWQKEWGVAVGGGRDRVRSLTGIYTYICCHFETLLSALF